MTSFHAKSFGSTNAAGSRRGATAAAAFIPDGRIIRLRRCSPRGPQYNRPAKRDPVFDVSMPSLLGWTTLFCALVAASIMVWYLRVRPELTINVRVQLLLGLGVLPAIAAGAETVDGLERTTHREFCGSCHVMDMHLADALDPASDSLASRHTHSKWFGDKACYTCHANYGMYGYPLTKLNGMQHVLHYYTSGYLGMTVEDAVKRLKLYQPYTNDNCMQCHSGTLPTFVAVPDHKANGAALASDEVSCVSAGCHGYAHPFNKPSPDETAGVGKGLTQ